MIGSIVHRIGLDFLNNKRRKILRTLHRNTSTKMNLIKSYAMIAVVAGHANGGGISYAMSNWIHPGFYYMPLFVFVSGYFYKEENDLQPFFRFLKQKLSALVIPYFLWNLFYGALNHIFRTAGVINYGDKISLFSLFVRPWIDGHQYHFNIASWFLLTLFIDTIVIFTLRKLFRKVNLLSDFALLGLTLVISVVSISLAQKGHNQGIYLCFIRAGYMLPYFQLGFWYKKHESIIHKNNALSIGIMMAAMYFLWVAAGSQGLGAQAVFARFSGNPVLITALTIVAILLTAAVCEILVPAFEHSNIVHSIGNNTFTIMMHHGIVIFLINFAIYLLGHVTEVSSFNVSQFQKTLWYTCPWRDSRIYIVYVVLGIYIPLFLKKNADKLIISLYDKSAVK